MSIEQKIILLVEDDNALLSTLQIRFQLENCEIISAKNGKEGLDLALTEQPDLILTDIMMPDMDGIDMVRQIRTKGDQWGVDVPVIFLTNANNASARKNEAFMLNADYMIKSDSSLKDIIAKIEERIGEDE